MPKPCTGQELPLWSWEMLILPDITWPRPAVSSLMVREHLLHQCHPRHFSLSGEVT